MKKFMILSLMLVMICSVFAERKALVIANGNYAKVSLKSPVADASDMDAALRSVGFNVSRYNNVKKAEMNDAIAKFIAGLSPEDEAFFYFSGHGINYNNVNYIIPAGLNLSSNLKYDRLGYNLNNLSQKLSRAKTSIIMLEASRVWAPDGKKAVAKSFGPMSSADSSQVIVMSQLPGQQVYNSNLSKSLFTQIFIKHLAASEDGLNLLMPKVIEEVRELSNAQQTPWLSNNLKEDFFFKVMGSKWRFKSWDFQDIEGGGSISW